jgi:hypothetical protein
MEAAVQFRDTKRFGSIIERVGLISDDSAHEARVRLIERLKMRETS